jgi:hypothetical protein
LENQQESIATGRIEAVAGNLIEQRDLSGAFDIVFLIRK